MHATSLISKILVSSHEVILDNFKDKIDALQLKMNQVVDAKVSKVLPNGKAKLSIQGQTVVAKTHVLLTEGETIRLQAVSDGDSKTLKLVTKPDQTTIPEGLKEMRAFGRSGLYSKLTKVLSDNLPAFEKQFPNELTKAELTTPSKQNQPDVKLQETAPGAPTINKTTPAAGTTRSFDASDLKAFIENKTIPWSQKAGSLIVQAEAAGSAVPEKMLEKLAEKLVLSFSRETPANTLKPVLEQLSAVVQKTGDTLSLKDNAAISTVVKDTNLPMDYKLLAVLSSNKESDPVAAGAVKPLIQPEDLLPVRKILIQALKQNGYTFTGDSLTTNPVVVDTVNSAPNSLHLFKQLETLLGHLSLNSGEEPDNESLKSIVKNSGLMWESKLGAVVNAFKGRINLNDAEALVNNDIKALSMKLAQVLEGENKNTGKTLRSFVEGLEKMQVLNTYSSEESGRYLLPLPFFLNETLKFGQLLIDLDRDGNSQQKDNDKVTRLAFILELTRLGHLKADFAVYKKSISGEFGVENAEIQSLFNELIPGLIETFEEKGYTIKKIGCSVISSGELAGTSLTDMVIDNPDGVINIIV